MLEGWRFDDRIVVVGAIAFPPLLDAPPALQVADAPGAGARRQPVQQQVSRSEIGRASISGRGNTEAKISSESVLSSRPQPPPAPRKNPNAADPGSTPPTSPGRSRSTTPSESSPSRRPTLRTLSASAAALPPPTASASARSGTRGAASSPASRSTTSTRPSPASSTAASSPRYLIVTATGRPPSLSWIARASRARR